MSESILVHQALVILFLRLYLLGIFMVCDLTFARGGILSVIYYNFVGVRDENLRNEQITGLSHPSIFICGSFWSSFRVFLLVNVCFCDLIKDFVLDPLELV